MNSTGTFFEIVRQLGGGSDNPEDFDYTEY